MIFNKTLLTVLIVTFLTFTLFNISSGTSVNNSLEIKNEKDYNGFIIQFNEEPVLRFKNRLVEKAVSIVSEIIIEYKEELISIHNRAKEEISAILGLDDSSNGFFSTEFYNLFNGICVKTFKKKMLVKSKIYIMLKI